MTEDERKEVYKQAMKEAFSEWLDKQFSTFGRWSLGGLAALLFVHVVELIAKAGWLHIG